MLEKKIEIIRQQLDEMILTEGLRSKRLLQQSQVLDLLLVDYMRRNSYISSNPKATSQSDNFIQHNKKRENASGQQQDDTLIYDLILAPIKAG